MSAGDGRQHEKSLAVEEAARLLLAEQAHQRLTGGLTEDEWLEEQKRAEEWQKARDAEQAERDRAREAAADALAEYGTPRAVAIAARHLRDELNRLVDDPLRRQELWGRLCGLITAWPALVDGEAVRLTERRGVVAYPTEGES